MKAMKEQGIEIVEVSKVQEFMSRNKLRVGVISVGYVASNNFLPVIPRFDDVEPAGILANHLESEKKAQRLCGAQEVVESLEELV